MNLLHILFFVLCLKKIHSQDGPFLCTGRTCSDIIDNSPCLEIPDNCKIQNATHNGLILPSPNTCNCCTFCLVNLNEGDFCALGEEGGIVPSSICGPGLTCSVNGICVKMSDAPQKNTCPQAQADYDKKRASGDLGVMQTRPNCDASGFYEPYRCLLGETCFCVDRDGTRIFGEIPYTSVAANVMKCECSRKYSDAEVFHGRSLRPNEHFRCADNGDYDTIQCIGDNCMCTDASDGAPTFPTADSVNITDISKDTLKCFNPEIHKEGGYYHECAQRYMELFETVEKYKADGYSVVFNIEFPRCTIDGKYAPVQKDAKTNELFCAHTNGSQIENYRVEADNNEDAMNCKCARTRLLIPENAPEKPECCPNGNFKTVQCRRGKCFCVDEDGYQTVKEVDSEDIANLKCPASTSGC